MSIFRDKKKGIEEELKKLDFDSLSLFIVRISLNMSNLL
jgi:hypothetical protein